ncbi:MAG: hypothetical protein LBB86_04885, partial [Oscillospiraceae bacterium]|nr:hypothetical protein [Oscillospiraceae bacterium]
MRADKRYSVSVTYRMPDGTKRRRYFYGKTQREAREKLDKFKHDVLNGLNMEMYEATFESYAKRWLNLREPHAAESSAYVNTLKAYAMYIKVACELIGGKRVRDVTLSDIQLVLNKFEGKSKSCITKAVSVLKGIFETAIGDRIITFNPMDNAVAPKGTIGTHRMLDESEVARVRDMHADASLHLGAMLML